MAPAPDCLPPALISVSSCITGSHSRERLSTSSARVTCRRSLPKKMDGSAVECDGSANRCREGNKTVRRCFPALAEAAAVVGSIQIRNRATLVGNVCNASPAADTVPVLAVYSAVVKIIGRGGERSLPLIDFIQGNRRTALVAGELATALCIPFPSKPFGSAFARVTRRYSVDLAAVNVCCGIDGSGMSDSGIWRRVAAPAGGARSRWRPRRSVCCSGYQICRARRFDLKSHSHHGCACKCGIPPGDAQGTRAAGPTPRCRKTSQGNVIWVI